MNPSENFVRHAAECELMAKFTHLSENRAVWIRMAERWLRCAELNDRQTLAAHDAKLPVAPNVPQPETVPDE